MHEKPETPFAPKWVDDPPNRMLRWLFCPLVGSSGGLICGSAFGLIHLLLPAFLIHSAGPAILLFAVLGAVCGAILGALGSVVINGSIWIIGEVRRGTHKNR